LQVSSGCGVATDSVLVKVYSAIYVPNAFTPNGDGVNDAWEVRALDGYTKADVMIFNRWGQMVYRNNGNPVKWDGTFRGKLQPSGIFCYLIQPGNGMKA